MTKLFHLVQPDIAVFGDKDRQQCEVAERMVRDLFFPLRIVRHAVVREKDGLPRSSRNSRLNPVQRRAAGSWARALAEAARAGKGRAIPVYRQKLKKLPGVSHEYVEAHGGRLYAAVRVGGVRLIDHRPCGRSR